MNDRRSGRRSPHASDTAPIDETCCGRYGRKRFVSADNINAATRKFVDRLRTQPEVVGIILFGSWARGTPRADSDVDLIVLLTHGYRRAVEIHDAQAFEIIYNTPEASLAYWKSHLDDAVSLWSAASILFDPNGIASELRDEMREVIRAGKAPLDPDRAGQLRFDVEDTLRCARSLLAADPTTATLLMSSRVLSLTELYFDLRRQWTPPLKQRHAVLAAESPVFSRLMREWATERLPIEERLALVERMIPLVFDGATTSESLHPTEESADRR